MPRLDSTVVPAKAGHSGQEQLSSRRVVIHNGFMSAKVGVDDGPIIDLVEEHYGWRTVPMQDDEKCCDERNECNFRPKSNQVYVADVFHCNSFTILISTELLAAPVAKSKLQLPGVIR